MHKKILFLFLTLGILFYACQEKEPTIEIVPPEQVYAAIQGDTSIQLVDVRTQAEYQVNHIKKSQNICVTNKDFKEKIAKLDKKKPVYVYCGKGGRSAKAAEILKEMGFVEVYDLQGGLQNWNSNGLETVN